ncbi:MAG: PilZ domain-containing protein [Terracidiphilus sp.]
MERQKYCVYNETSECFLSLGVTLAVGAIAQVREILRKRPHMFDDGHWVMRPKSIHTLGLFSPRDLVYLDADHRVIDVIESLPLLRIARMKAGVASLLALPIHTIYSSQTQPGNQLVICLAEEMEFRLRSMPRQSPEELNEPALGNCRFAQRQIPSDVSRLRFSLQHWPKLVACDSTGAKLKVQGIKDISAGGLYLMTEERWPLGTRVALTLQKTRGGEENSQAPMTVQLRVTRWGGDGIGLAFIQSEARQPLLAMQTGAR